jgi:hypothetical protein
MMILYHGPLPFSSQSPLLPLPPRKTYWTMSVDNVGLRICLLGTFNYMVTLKRFPWCQLKWSWDEFLHAITKVTRPWDDFMVYGVNSP